MRCILDKRARAQAARVSYWLRIYLISEDNQQVMPHWCSVEKIQIAQSSSTLSIDTIYFLCSDAFSFDPGQRQSKDSQMTAANRFERRADVNTARETTQTNRLPRTLRFDKAFQLRLPIDLVITIEI